MVATRLSVSCSPLPGVSPTIFVFSKIVYLYFFLFFIFKTTNIVKNFIEKGVDWFAKRPNRQF